MSYAAIVCEIRTEPHPNADRLQVAKAAGYTCVVGLEHQDGEMGILFPEGGQLSDWYCRRNNLYRKDPVTGETMGGYLEANRRVRAVTLRGVESDALWLPLSSLPLTTRHALFEGETLTHWDGEDLCRKYVTPATERAQQALSKSKKAKQPIARHYDTPQLRDAREPTGTFGVIVTEKLHGTSGRTGHVLVDKPQGWLRRLLRMKPRQEWKVVSGTRNCMLDHTAPGEKGKGYRQAVHDLLAPHIAQGETWFYEIVGYDENAKPIMPPHRIEGIGDRKIEKRLKKAAGGDTVVYDYGCNPGQCAVYVYRIEHDGRDLAHSEIFGRLLEALMVGPLASELVSRVSIPQCMWVDDEWPSMEELNEMTRGPSEYGPPLKEGICVRVEHYKEGDEHRTVSKTMKHKSFLFCALEGIRKNDPEYIDTEEAA